MLDVMRDLLWGRPTTALSVRRGFGVFAFLLRQLSPQVWSVEAVVALSNLASCFAADEGLHHEALCLVFGDARLWLLTPADVQFEVHELLHAAVERKPLAFLAPPGGGPPLLSVQALLDSLEVYYWATPTAASHGRAPLHHAVTGAVIGERPPPDALRRLRAKVLRLLCVLCEARLPARRCRDRRLVARVPRAGCSARSSACSSAG